MNMLDYEIRSALPSLRTFEVPVKGTGITCQLALMVDAPSTWHYTLWRGSDQISHGTLGNVIEDATASEVSKLAYEKWEAQEEKKMIGMGSIVRVLAPQGAAGAEGTVQEVVKGWAKVAFIWPGDKYADVWGMPVKHLQLITN